MTVDIHPGNLVHLGFRATVTYLNLRPVPSFVVPHRWFGVALYNLLTIPLLSLSSLRRPPLSNVSNPS